MGEEKRRKCEYEIEEYRETRYAQHITLQLLTPSLTVEAEAVPTNKIAIAIAIDSFILLM